MEEKREFVTKTADKTRELGFKFAGNLSVCDIVLLEGNLGAGKTTFMQGVAKALKIKSRIISPTFVLVRSHKGKLKNSEINLHHIDLYRIENESEISKLGLKDLMSDKNSLTFIEWGKKTDKINYTWEVSFKVKDSSRIIKIVKNE